MRSGDDIGVNRIRSGVKIFLEVFGEDEMDNEGFDVLSKFKVTF